LDKHSNAGNEGGKGKGNKRKRSRQRRMKKIAQRRRRRRCRRPTHLCWWLSHTHGYCSVVAAATMRAHKSRV